MALRLKHSGRNIRSLNPSIKLRTGLLPVIESKFRAGTRVQHPLWDEGIVLNSRIQDDDEIVEVVFESVGIKRLAASLANLTIIA